MPVDQAAAESNGASLAEQVRREEAAYKHGEDRPLRSYSALVATYLTLTAAGSVVVRRLGRVPERIEASDLALAAVATHKLSRLVTKESVTSPLRAGFTRFVGPAGPGELNEEVRGTGARKAVGELLTCPFCIGHWIATAFIFGFALAPRATRMVASVLATVTGADFLQFAHAAAQHKAEESG